MFVYDCCGSILNSVLCLLVASGVLLDSVGVSYASVECRPVLFKLNVYRIRFARILLLQIRHANEFADGTFGF